MSGNTVIVPGNYGGLAFPYRNINLNATGATVKATAGQLYGWVISNNANAARYVKFYNKASPTVGTDTIVLTLEVPANSTGQFFMPTAIAFGTAIGIGATTGVADNDTGNPSSNDIVANILFL